MNAVGIFDSGLGGISFLKEAVRLMPEENYIYFGDNAHAPYGDKPEAEVNALALDCARKLCDAGVKAIVVACNTATGTAIRSIRDSLLIPVVSVEPAIKPACAIEGDGKILMLATSVTTNMMRYQALKARMPEPARIIDVACSGVVDRIESGVFEDDAFDDLLERHLGRYAGMKVDAIVLGCTHYVFIKGAIRRYAAAHFEGEAAFTDGNRGTALQLERVLRERGLRDTSGKGAVEFMTSGDYSRYKPMFDMLMARRM
ncbi:MAG: glutamate racemase [Clostridia bacterium]|nr:glutamate racemase [Clostridia bacterium]